MKTIHKWTLTPGSTDLHMPEGANVLTVQMQGDQPQLWALVDPAQPKTWRTFEIHGAGHSLPENPGEYVATFQMDGGELVLHVFET
jgi:hypothetical protein